MFATIRILTVPSSNPIPDSRSRVNHTSKAEIIAASLYAAIQQPQSKGGKARHGGQSTLMVNMTSSKSYSILTEGLPLVNERIQKMAEVVELR